MISTSVCEVNCSDVLYFDSRNLHIVRVECSHEVVYACQSNVVYQGGK